MLLVLICTSLRESIDNYGLFVPKSVWVDGNMYITQVQGIIYVSEGLWKAINGLLINTHDHLFFLSTDNSIIYIISLNVYYRTILTITAPGLTPTKASSIYLPELFT